MAGRGRLEGVRGAWMEEGLQETSAGRLHPHTRGTFPWTFLHGLTVLLMPPLVAQASCLCWA